MDDLIPLPRISKRQRETSRGSVEKQEKQQQRGQQLRSAGTTSATQVLRNVSRGSVRQQETLWGYAESLKGNVGSTSPILGLRNPLQASAEGRRGWRRGFRGTARVSRAKIWLSLVNPI